MFHWLTRVFTCKILVENKIEGIKLEYEIIKKCNIASDLRSKIWRLVTSKKNDRNIEFSIDLFNIDSKNGVKWGHSIPYHHQQGAPHPTGTPFDPVFTVDVK